MRLGDLFEAPIEDFGLVGDWNKGSAFRHAQDRRLLTNPKAVEKIKAKWLATPFPFNMFFVNLPEATKLQYEVGEVNHGWLREHMPTTYSEIGSRLSGEAINVIFTGNYGAERTPMTAWTIAHRFGHAIARYPRSGGPMRSVQEFTDAKDALIRSCSEVLAFYGHPNFPESDEDLSFPKLPFGNERAQKVQNAEKALLKLYHAIGTMRSAREGMIRTEFEFMLELLAQYILTKHVRFNPLPRVIGTKRGQQLRFQGSDADFDYANSTIEILADAMEDHFGALLHACMGRIFVM